MTKDNYVPLFSGAPSDYREWRKRITLYMTKMKLLKREAEGVLNLISSLSGTAWKVVELSRWRMWRRAMPSAV